METRHAKGNATAIQHTNKQMCTAHLSNRCSFWRSSSLLSGTLGNTTSCSTVTRQVLSSQYLQGRRAGIEESIVHAVTCLGCHTQEVPASQTLGNARAIMGACRDDTKQRAVTTSGQRQYMCTPPPARFEQVNARR